MTTYEEFLESKTQLGGNFGFTPTFVPDFLFDFQKALVTWAIEKGRAEIMADCGLGKTPKELVWAENVIRHTNKPVLLLTPLGVTGQMVSEAEKFGIEASKSTDGRPGKNVTITNYEKLHLFNPDDFSGVVCDESSILKSFDGSRKNEITIFMRKVKYRLLATATAAPNDYIELGTSSEALGYLGHMDMLGKFFKNDQNNCAQKSSYVGQSGGHVEAKWRFKGHAEKEFWRWVCSWARAIRKPSDLGFSDDAFILPELSEIEHVVESSSCADGMLFPMPAVGLKEQRQERGRTIDERCAKVAELVNHDQPALVWCHLNPEGDMIERMIPGSVQVSGKDSDEAKEEAFAAFVKGEARVLITKPKIGAWGLNFQHCNHTTFFPSHSYEQYYQGIRRLWRFGQKRPVRVDVVTTEGELSVLKNLQRKSKQSEKMFSQLIEQMNQALHIGTAGKFDTEEVIPSWL